MPDFEQARIMTVLSVRPEKIVEASVTKQKEKKEACQM